MLQLLLPLGFERENNKDFEEVNIPPSDPAPTNIGRNLVPISQLDEVRYLNIVYQHIIHLCFQTEYIRFLYILRFSRFITRVYV